MVIQQKKYFVDRRWWKLSSSPGEHEHEQSMWIGHKLDQKTSSFTLFNAKISLALHFHGVKVYFLRTELYEHHKDRTI